MTDQLHDIEVVLVHGGWADGSCWIRVIQELRQRGLVTSAAQLPLSSFQADVAALSSHIESRKASNVILVGHSYGGAVITEVAARYATVEGLVYVAASAPVPGQTFGAFMQEHPGPVPVALKPDGHGLLWATRGAFVDALAHDLPSDEIEVLYAVQKPLAAAVLGDSVSVEGWRGKTCWYVVADEDRLFSPTDQLKLAERMQARVSHCHSGHFVPLSCPTELADIIAVAAQE